MSRLLVLQILIWLFGNLAASQTTTAAVDAAMCASALESCSLHGRCVNDKMFGGLKCVCDHGFAGNKCATGPPILVANTPQKSVVKAGEANECVSCRVVPCRACVLQRRANRIEAKTI